MTNSNTSQRRQPTRRIIQNFHLVWLDGCIDEDDDDYRNFLIQLRQVVNTVNTFIDADECIDFIDSIQEENTFMIFSGAFGERNVPIFHDKKQVSVIYIFCGNKTRHERWTKQWPKIKGVFTDIQPICETLKQAAQDCDHNAVSISFATTGDTATSAIDKNTLDCSFMYTQILKDILLTIKFDQQHINDFLNYCRVEFAENPFELNNIEKIEKIYCDHQPIWWYTCETFLYSMLNKALRLMDIDIIIKMAFFVCDLHNNIVDLHSKQFDDHTSSSNSFIVYRGQNLSQADFNQLKQSQDGLLAFNNFLSTSKNRNTSLDFINRNSSKNDLVSVLFVMHVDPSIKSTPFADIDKFSAIGGEEEILFSMHSVFRIGQIKQLAGSKLIWEAELTLTSDNDPELRKLAENIQDENSSNCTGWDRLGKLLIQLAKFDKAEELYKILLKQTTDRKKKSHILCQLGWINDDQKKYPEAIEYYEQSRKIIEKIDSANHSELAVLYNNIGLTYDNMNELSEALEYYEKSLEIEKQNFPDDHPKLAALYNNIGRVYKKMDEFSEALEYYEKALKIDKKTLPAYHPNLATSYNNIALVYRAMGEYSAALEYQEKTLEIQKKSLPADHPELAITYSNNGVVYYDSGEYEKAINCFEKSVEIWKKRLPDNHSKLVILYKKIGETYKNIDQYSKALDYLECALNIQQDSLPPDHPHIYNLKKNIESIKTKL